MWKPLITHDQISKNDLELLLRGEIPAIVVKNFYDDEQCQKIIKRIKSSNLSNFQDRKLMHIGPFLMEYSTRKKEYFESAKKSRKTIHEIFSGIKKPNIRLQEIMRQTISIANDMQERYSECIIRIHHKGKEIPIHKDNVSYEGNEFNIAKINGQLSCVIHIQESKKGGKLVIYDKQWSRKDERFRDIDFGYTSSVIEDTNYIKLNDIMNGDAVIINTNFYHRITRIQGNNPRISVGMFMGIYNDKIVTWA